MRWLVYGLLLANATLLAWEVRRLEPQAAPVSAERVTGSAYVSRLLLLSEVDTSELRERVAAPVAAEPAPDPAAAAQETLLATLDAQGSDPAPDAPAPAPAAAPDTRVCYSAGPLEDDSEIARMRDWLLERGGEPELRSDERREVALYWVYFPPLESRQAAIDRVDQLRAEGIEDIYIIPRGDQGNAISLGVYSQRRSLQRRLDQLGAKGYSPSITPRYRTKLAAWFDVEFEAGFTYPQHTFADLFPAVEMAPVSCWPRRLARERPASYDTLGPRIPAVSSGSPFRPAPVVPDEPDPEEPVPDVTAATPPVVDVEVPSAPAPGVALPGGAVPEAPVPDVPFSGFPGPAPGTDVPGARAPGVSAGEEPGVEPLPVDR